jgi:hypothetical protein
MEMRRDLSIDQQAAMHSAAVRLRGDFDGVFGTETIERFLTSSYDQFAENAAVTQFLPLLAERFVQRTPRCACSAGFIWFGRVPAMPAPLAAARRAAADEK